ncbi:uncharacterized protein LAESUDRAFT_733025 [Laetiporus sulphureus 93-53]|uniref:Uncharacterized protein n=1 Tax=Laetiporus sulphureus 93-53 TaxID=1314785 RepID=A0A165ATR1_9APHY|nr:uncharacterized protein LAESUDRAFT_733025 [Laetiporus sulphureus 93-53]KZS99646.1 hypothetical protein LAESUDRAFT_733025 [Laetiporus sulphureus 93-53]
MSVDREEALRCLCGHHSAAGPEIPWHRPSFVSTATPREASDVAYGDDTDERRSAVQSRRH